MYEEEILRCESILENIEKFGLVKNHSDFTIPLYEETGKLIAESIENDTVLDKDVLKAYRVVKKVCNLADGCFVPWKYLSDDIGIIENEARLGSSNSTGVKLIPFVDKINAIFCIESPSKPSNKVAFSWSKAFGKDNPRAYLLGCLRNYLSSEGADFTEDEIRMIVGFKEDPWFASQH